MAKVVIESGHQAQILCVYLKGLGKQVELDGSYLDGTVLFVPGLNRFDLDQVLADLKMSERAEAA